VWYFKNAVLRYSFVALSSNLGVEEVRGYEGNGGAWGEASTCFLGASWQ
jgi:hypothetical protein